jgi:biopolymer transport protein ExbD
LNTTYDGLDEQDEHGEHADEVLTEEEREIAEAYGRLHGKKKKREKPHLPGEEIAGLNLTPMMDMMTILLVYLVQSFATDPSAIIKIDSTMRPPESTAEVAMKPATKVMVTTEMIIVDDKPVITLAEVGNTDKQLEIPPLVQALTTRKDALMRVQNAGGQEFDGRLLVIATEQTSYSLLTAVLYSAGQARFTQYQLVVLSESQN